MIVGFGGMSAEEHVAIVVNGRDLHPSVTQQLVRVPAGRAPQRVKYHASSSLLNRGKINDLSQARQVGWFHVEQFGGRLACAASTIRRILQASQERPFLSLRLELAPTLVGEVMVEAGHASPRDSADTRAIAVSPLDANLLDASVRLTRLLDAPAEARVLMPLITREMIYRLLVGEQGTRLRHLAILSGYTPSIARAVERLRQDFDQPLRVEQLARELGMSVSGLHHHFKAVTALSPSQFQKRLRLLEARRLLLGENIDAASAAYRVGYQDTSHFNREYKSFFGVPPMRDVQRLREGAQDQASR